MQVQRAMQLRQRKGLFSRGERNASWVPDKAAATTAPPDRDMENNAKSACMLQGTHIYIIFDVYCEALIKSSVCTFVNLGNGRCSSSVRQKIAEEHKVQTTTMIYIYMLWKAI